MGRGDLSTARRMPRRSSGRAQRLMRMGGKSGARVSPDAARWGCRQTPETWLTNKSRVSGITEGHVADARCGREKKGGGKGETRVASAQRRKGQGNTRRWGREGDLRFVKKRREARKGFPRSEDEGKMQRRETWENKSGYRLSLLVTPLCRERRFGRRESGGGIRAARTRVGSKRAAEKKGWTVRALYLAACAAAPTRLPIAMTSCGTASRLPPTAAAGIAAWVVPVVGTLADGDEAALEADELVADATSESRVLEARTDTALAVLQCDRSASGTWTGSEATIDSRRGKARDRGGGGGGAARRRESGSGLRDARDAGLRSLSRRLGGLGRLGCLGRLSGESCCARGRSPGGSSLRRRGRGPSGIGCGLGRRGGRPRSRSGGTRGRGPSGRAGRREPRSGSRG